jgi:hypothetical protein
MVQKLYKYIYMRYCYRRMCALTEELAASGILEEEEEPAKLSLTLLEKRSIFGTKVCQSAALQLEHYYYHILCICFTLCCCTGLA